jgi:uncharacterized protein (DUF2062 family)
VNPADRSRRRGFVARWRRRLYLELVVPLRRARDAPEYAARSVMVGLGLGLTPTDGLQLALLSLLWFLFARLGGWRFNWLIAAAWTTVTNPLTIPPIYFAFYLTGSALTGAAPLTYEVFVTNLGAAMPDAGGAFATALAYVTILVRDIGLVMLVGSLPYAATGAALGYLAAKRAIDRYRTRRRPSAIAAVNRPAPPRAAAGG